MRRLWNNIMNNAKRLPALAAEQGRLHLLRTMVAVFPYAVASRKMLARKLLAMGDVAEAAEHYREMLRQGNVDRFTTSMALADCCNRQGLIDAAVQATAQAIALQPQNARARSIHAELLHRCGRFVEAEAGWQEFERRTGPLRAEHTQQRCASLLKLGRTGDARRLAEGKQDIPAHERLACITQSHILDGDAILADAAFARYYAVHDLSSPSLTKMLHDPAALQLFDEATPQPQAACPTDELISVVVTTFNAQQWVEQAIRSLLTQTHQNTEVIIVDDASVDGTAAICEVIARKDSRVSTLPQSQNRGTYWCKNVGLNAARGTYVAFQDADDVSHPHRLALQAQHLSTNANLVGSWCRHLRINPDGSFLEQGQRFASLFPITMMLRRAAVFASLGSFDTVRIGADTEMVRRLQIVFGVDKILGIDIPLYFARGRARSLTGDPLLGISDQGPSPLRRRYEQESRRWHETLRRGEASPYLPFPQRVRPFPVSVELLS